MAKPMTDNQRLAELMGWKEDDDYFYFHNLHKYDTELNAMREVWKVLKEQAIWINFIDAWVLLHFEHMGVPYPNSSSLRNAAIINAFVNDLPGQVQAAIEVLDND